MTKAEARLVHQNLLREIIVYGLADVKVTPDLKRKERQARAWCLSLGDCKCVDGIRKKL